MRSSSRFGAALTRRAAFAFQLVVAALALCWIHCAPPRRATGGSGGSGGDAGPGEGTGGMTDTGTGGATDRGTGGATNDGTGGTQQGSGGASSGGTGGG